MLDETMGRQDKTVMHIAVATANVSIVEVQSADTLPRGLNAPVSLP